jgi:hypothetical protein
MLGPVRRAIHEEHGRRGRHGVDDPDHRLLRDAALSAPGQGQDAGAQQGRAETGRVGHERLDRQVQEERDGRPERGDLGERDVDEDDLARDHVDAKVGVDARQDQAHQERRPHQGEEVAGTRRHRHRCGQRSACARTRTLNSKRSR